MSDFPRGLSAPQRARAASMHPTTPGARNPARRASFLHEQRATGHGGGLTVSVKLRRIAVLTQTNLDVVLIRHFLNDDVSNATVILSVK